MSTYTATAPESPRDTPIGVVITISGDVLTIYARTRGTA